MTIKETIKIMKNYTTELIIVLGLALFLGFDFGGRQGFFGFDFYLVMISTLAFFIGLLMIYIPVPVITIPGVWIAGVSFFIGSGTIITMFNNVSNRIPGGWTTLIIGGVLLYFIPRMMRR